MRIGFSETWSQSATRRQGRTWGSCAFGGGIPLPAAALPEGPFPQGGDGLQVGRSRLPMGWPTEFVAAALLLLFAWLPLFAQAPTSASQEALAGAGLRPVDLAFPLLPQERDSLRLARVDEVLKNGRPLDLWADSLCAAASSSQRLGQLTALLLPELRRVHGEVMPQEAPLPGRCSMDWDAWVKELCAIGRERVMPDEGLDTVEQDLSDLLQEDPGHGERTVFELDSLERLSEADAHQRRMRLEHATLPEPARLLELLARLDRLYLDLDDLARAVAERRVVEHERFGPVLYADKDLAIGSEGDNHWEGELPPVIVDLGGNDSYRGQVAVSRGGVALVLDMEGDDSYRAVDDIGPAATVCGLSLLMDLEGDDRYDGDFASLGAALGGLALLVDQEGDDRYLGDTFSQGAGSLGMGLLVDAGGHDSYQCGLYGQGFGHVGGLGLLQDASGNDQYLMQPRYVDQIRYDDHHLTLGQGFGYGLRPDLSGGIGLLNEGGGNDLYSADIYGQGAAYWWALGALVDRDGHDRYLAWQYAQGAGVHLAAGILMDDAGMDVYQSRGVSQGCGHDLALGWLLDRAGEDSYEAWDLSQGAGNANGTGILTDLAGEDLYAMRNPGKPRAYGDPRRRTGSLGLFFDGQGRDHYLGIGANDSLWMASLRGHGQDRPGRATAPPVVTALSPVLELDPTFRVGDSVDRLYVWAIRLEPKWARERDAARSELKARPQEWATLVRARRLMGTRISWERHALKDLVAAMGQDALPLLREAVEGPVPPAGDERELRLRERAFALWVLSEASTLGDAALFENWWKAGLCTGEAGQEALLVECLALHMGAQEPLLEAIRKPQAGLRRSAAWGLGRLPVTEAGRRALFTALGDSILAVRMSAFESLAGDSLLPMDRVVALLRQDRSPATARVELLRLAARVDALRCRALLPELTQDADLAEECRRLDACLPKAPPAATTPARRRR